MNKYTFKIKKRGKTGLQYHTTLTIEAKSIIEARVILCLYCDRYDYIEI